MSVAENALALVVVLPGAVAATGSLYLLVLALAARRHRTPVAGRPATRVAVIVPAHDEAGLIARCVASLRAQAYPPELVRLVVVADNCRDDTAARAAAAGASVLVRQDPSARGKGHALRWAIPRILREHPDVDAIAVVDADTIADPAWLATLVGPLQHGALAVQGESLLIEDGSSRTALRVAAFLLINRVRPAGRAALGLPCSLCGNGMLLTRELLVHHPWNALSATEDLEFAVTLRRAGIGPAFARGAILTSAAAPDARAAAQQQLRWEGGKVQLALRLVPRLVRDAVRERRPGLLDVAFELALPPFALLTGAAALGAASSAGLLLLDLVPGWVLAPWLVALAALPLYVVIGLRVAGAPPSCYRAMTRAPLLVVAKALGVRRLLGFRADSWVRTARTSADEP